MSVTTIAPSNGDTVSSPVTVSCEYSIDADCIITSSVGPNGDDGKPVVYSPPEPDIGESDSDPIAVDVSSDTVYAVIVDAGDEGYDSSVSVTVTADGGPAPVGGITITIPEMGGGPGAGQKTKYKVDGEVAPASTAAYVVCQAIEIDLGPPVTRTVVAAGSGNIKAAGNKLTWSVSLEFTPDADLQYVARAFAYDMNQNLLGSFTVPFKK
jgi:hypothetical protein